MTEWLSALGFPLLEARAALLAPTPVAQGARFATLLLGVALLALTIGWAPSTRSRRGTAALLGVTSVALGMLLLAQGAL